MPKDKKKKKKKDAELDLMYDKSITITIGNTPIVLRYNELSDEIDVDNLTKIQYDNLYGESVTVAVIMNQVGALKARAEEEYNEKKLVFQIYESRVKKNLRVEAARNSGKFKMDGEMIKLTEDGLKEAVMLDKEWQAKKREMHASQKNMDVVESLMWAINSKDKKLNVLVKGVSPEEFAKELVEGKINNIFLQKRESIIERSKR